MNSFLLNRQLGSVSHQALAAAQNERLVQSIQAAPNVNFALRLPEEGRNAPTDNTSLRRKNVAHAAGVNSIEVDRFEGRYLLSGGADSSVAIWDLEAEPHLAEHGTSTHLPLGHVTRTSLTESLGITDLSFYPFDSGAFLTSSYDRSLKLFSSDTLTASATFDIGSTVYAHATSPIATHLLVACASHHPAVRLVDLRIGSATHSLAGHSGAVLSVAWHPRHEHILASGATDGSVRLWDIRRSASSLGVLDMEDSIGVAGYDGKGTGARRRERGRAHGGAVNGIVWTADGAHLVTTGHDDRMRVWDMSTGANTLTNFGPALKNRQNLPLRPLLVPAHLSPSSSTAGVYYPNPNEVLSFDLHSGDLQKRMRVTSRTTSLTWRAHAIEMYSAHVDGTIRCWKPRDVVVEEEVDSGAGEHEAAEKKRKREEMEGIVRDLTRKKMTFT